MLPFRTLPFTAEKEELTAAFEELGSILAVVKRLRKVTFDGLTVFNRDIDDALPSDIFTGDEIATWGYVDLSKAQMFFFTTVLALAYALDIAGMLTGVSPQLKAFPNVDPIMAGF